jgi:hypothetical protein
MSYKKKSWKEKLENNNDLPKIEKLPGHLQERWGGRTMVIATPMEVNNIMKKVRNGKLITINKIREKLATKHGADIACPITTGIFAWIAANAAVEMRKPLAYWRTLKGNGELNEKYPGGISKQAEKLESEGHNVFQKGKKWMVTNWQKSQVK